MYLSYCIFFKPLLNRGQAKPKNINISCHKTACVIFCCKFVGKLLNLKQKYVRFEVLTAMSIKFVAL